MNRTFFGVCSVIFFTSFAGAASGPSISADQKSYTANQSVSITGSHFLPSGQVNLTVQRADQLTDSLTAIADSTGAFGVSYTPSSPVVAGTYTITGTASASVTASASFVIGTAVITDQSKYSVGQPMTISGYGFSANGPVSIAILRPDHV